MIEALETKHFVNAAGEYLGGFGGVRRTNEAGETSEEWPSVPAGAVEVPSPPASLLDRFVAGAWVSPAASVVAADNLKLARARIAGNPDMAALIEAIAARLSVSADALLDDVAERIGR